MKYRQRQRSDRHGSFPEPPNGMRDDDSVVTPKKMNRLRRSLKALKCFASGTKQVTLVASESRDNCGPEMEKPRDHGVAEPEFEVGSTSPNSSAEEPELEVETNSPTSSEEEPVFDVSQALQPVPEEEEEGEEEEEDGLDYPDPPLAFDEDSMKSTASDYSSDFITDDSTETSGLPYDSSLSRNDSMETTESETRVGIRPMELPPELGRVQVLDKAFLVKTEKSIPYSDNNQTGLSFQRATEKASHSSTSNDSATILETNQNGGRDKAQTPDNQSCESQETESTGYTTLMNSVVDLLEQTKSINETPSIEHKNTSSDVREGVKADRHKSTTQLTSRVKELILKYGGSPERVKPLEHERVSPPSSSVASSDLIDIPKEVMRHDVYKATENKGFFWRSHPTIAASEVNPLQGGTVTSISTIEGYRSLDYCDVFTQAELDRERLAIGEPSFIHI